MFNLSNDSVKFQIRNQHHKSPLFFTEIDRVTIISFKINGLSTFGRFFVSATFPFKLIGAFICWTIINDVRLSNETFLFAKKSN